MEEIRPLHHQQIFFTTFEYGHPYHITGKSEFMLNDQTEILLVSGIANPHHLKVLLEKHSKSYSMLHFPDHHIFTIDDLREIKKKFENLQDANKIILSTEKDAVRLLKFKSEIAALPLFIIPIRHRFLFDGATKFNGIVTNFIKNFRKAD